MVKLQDRSAGELYRKYYNRPLHVWLRIDRKFIKKKKKNSYELINRRMDLHWHPENMHMARPGFQC